METGPASHPSAGVNILSLTSAFLLNICLKAGGGAHIEDRPDVWCLSQGSHQAKRLANGV